MARDLIVREPRATISGEHAFKFKHVLIREVAYGGLAKSAAVEPVSGTVPVSENAALKVGAGLPPTMSIPIRDQSGSRFALRIQD